ncbi:hypothetical protein L208DRAFT_1214064, partial [Tricholoma matsutake]
MPLKPLEVLKKGLKILQDQVKAKKEKLQAQLHAKKSISSLDENWLDNEANLVDEQRVLDELENASDYKRGCKRLDETQKGVIRRLREVAGDLSKAVGRKWKRSEPKPKEPSEKKMSNKECSTPVFTKKENATLAQRIEILDWYHKNGKNQSKMAKHFDPIYPNLKMNQPLVSAWVKGEAKWWEEWAHSSGGHTAKRAHQTQHPEVTKMMELWVSKAMAESVLLTGEVLRQKWTKFADLAGVPQDEHLNLSDGWLSCFKARTGLKQFKRHGNAASADLEAVKREQKRVQELIDKYGYELRDIFNMDETGLFY